MVTQLIGDCVFCFFGLSAALWLRFFTPLRNLGFAAENSERYFVDYVPLLGLGTVLLLGTFFYLNLYDSRLLLRPHRAFALILKGLFFWFCVFLGTSLALKFEPPVSRLFVLFATATTLVCLLLWRYGMYRWLSASQYRESISQRVVILGWSAEAGRLVEAICQDSNLPYQVVGRIHSGPNVPITVPGVAELGRIKDLEDILGRHRPSILVVADLDLSREELESVAALCERLYIAFKIIPSFFQIFVSNLRLESISSVSILGVEDLPLDSLPRRLIKRSVDIVGALIGIVVSVPIVALLVFLIQRESPGPAIFYQERIGRGGRPFRMHKLRSMVVGAHLKDRESQSTQRNDARVTRVGAFMRRNNLDELPQFWNVLLGHMSLVGPRPERTFYVEQLSHQIPHYNPRHFVRPGMTGWAQVNGLRGDTSLVERIKYDLYYIENWSVWFDLQIMILTFVRLKRNAY
ncbi:MAG TPA: sugar transferase [Opitutaceae bacterium]|nr:sugar transferase [Opitutaceae bacterium]